MSNPSKNSIDQEQGSVIPSQASRITDSAQVTDLNHNERLKKNKDQARQKSAKSATKSNLDAESANDAKKLLTRARARNLASQDSQSKESHSLATDADYCIIPTHAPAPSRSRLTIRRLKD